MSPPPARYVVTGLTQYPSAEVQATLTLLDLRIVDAVAGRVLLIEGAPSQITALANRLPRLRLAVEREV